MKTTVEIPDELFRKAKSSAASKGQSMKRFLTDAISAKLDSESDRRQEKPWMSHFGALADHAEAARRVDRVIESEFEQVDPKDWR